MATTRRDGTYATRRAQRSQQALPYARPGPKPNASASSFRAIFRFLAAPFRSVGVLSADEEVEEEVNEDSNEDEREVDRDLSASLSDSSYNPPQVALALAERGREVKYALFWLSCTPLI